METCKTILAIKKAKTLPLRRHVMMKTHIKQKEQLKHCDKKYQESKKCISTKKRNINVWK